MGHMIEGIALSRGHEIVCIIDPIVGGRGRLEDADVAIEFTTPATAEANVRMAWAAGLPVVCGSTGWDVVNSLSPLTPLPIDGKGGRVVFPKQDGCPGLIWSSNFSIGVNVMFEISRQLADVLRPYGYKISMQEIHHIHKLDKPSGTAKTLAECVGYTGEIESIREGEVPGTHSIMWDSPEDTIVLSHIAKGRQGFALGAVMAAEEFDCR